MLTFAAHFNVQPPFVSCSRIGSPEDFGECLKSAVIFS
jgi:hypothetical protein